ncbi:unnamed protein product, partial [marine sediment metagenome]
MDLTPEIGTIITTETAIDYCNLNGLYYLECRIRENPGFFKEWEFDGASMIEDVGFSAAFNIP